MTLAQHNVELGNLADRAKAVQLYWGDSLEDKSVYDTVRGFSIPAILIPTEKSANLKSRVSTESTHILVLGELAARSPPS